MSQDSYVWARGNLRPGRLRQPFKDEDEAIRMANDSRFGLAAAVMSADVMRCERVAAAFRAGIVWINCSQPTFTEAPWGGYKQSGIGRELGRWGLRTIWRPSRSPASRATSRGAGTSRREAGGLAGVS